MRTSISSARKRWRSRSALVAVFACALMLCSCEPELSVHRLYGSDDVVFEPGLLGTWTMPESTNNEEVMGFEFTKSTSDGYTLIMTYQENPTAKTEKYFFAAHLVKLHGRVFIDVVPTSSQVDGQDSDGPPGIPAHFFGRISIDGDTLKMSFLDDEWVAGHVRSGDISIDTEEEDDKKVVLTASTAELQKLLVDHADDEQAFSVKLDDLKRKTIDSD